MKPPPNMLETAYDAPAFMQEKTYHSVITETLERSAKMASGPERVTSLVEEILGPINPDVSLTAMLATHLDKGAITDNKA